MSEKIQNQVPMFNGAIKADMANMKKILNGNKNLPLIESIFNKCDTEGKVDKNGKQVGDGELKGEERNNFLKALENAVNKLPISQEAKESLLGEVHSFFIAVDYSEDQEKIKQATKKTMKDTDNENMKNLTQNKIKNFNKLQ